MESLLALSLPKRYGSQTLRSSLTNFQISATCTTVSESQWVYQLIPFCIFLIFSIDFIQFLTINLFQFASGNAGHSKLGKQPTEHDVSHVQKGSRLLQQGKYDSEDVMPWLDKIPDVLTYPLILSEMKTLYP